MSEVVGVGVLDHDDEALIGCVMGVQPCKCICRHLFKVGITLACGIESGELVSRCTENRPHLSIIKQAVDQARPADAGGEYL